MNGWAPAFAGETRKSAGETRKSAGEIDPFPVMPAPACGGGTHTFVPQG